MKRAGVVSLALLLAPLLAAGEEPSFLGRAPWLDPSRTELWAASPQRKAVTTLAPIATSSKVAVRNAYTSYYAPAMPAMGFTGSVAGCTPGTISLAFKEWSISRVNYFRAMAQLPGNVALDTDPTRELQQQSAAVLYSANQRLSHDPAAEAANFPTCSSLIPNASAAGQNSNIALAFGSSTFDDVIPRYMDDSGAGNELLGHRRWILYPPQASMTIGSTPTTGGAWGGNALRVFNAFGSRPATPNGVAWPNAGFVPMAVLPASKRWSYSLNGASFTSATVSMTANGTPIGVTVISNNATGYGDNTIAFVPTPAIVKDTSYAVTVSGITGGPSSVTYTVMPFDTADPLGGVPGDFNRDGTPDIIFRNSGSGATFIWRMNGTSLISDQALGTVPSPWIIAGTGDFNGDGRNDVLWRNMANGAIYVWYLNDGALFSDALIATVDPVWKIEVVADFNRDGRPDLLLRHQGNGAAYIWYLNNTALLSDQFLFQIDPAWIVEGVGDFNRDGSPDLLFRNTSSGLAFVWNTAFSAGATSLTTSSAPVFGIDPAWEVVQVADWNLDGNVDLLFRNRNTGVIFVWYMTGTTLGSSAFVTQIAPSWEIVPRP